MTAVHNYLLMMIFLDDISIRLTFKKENFNHFSINKWKLFYV